MNDDQSLKKSLNQKQNNEQKLVLTSIMLRPFQIWYHFNFNYYLYDKDNTLDTENKFFNPIWMWGQNAQD